MGTGCTVFVDNWLIKVAQRVIKIDPTLHALWVKFFVSVSSKRDSFITKYHMVTSRAMFHLQLKESGMKFNKFQCGYLIHAQKYGHIVHFMEIIYSHLVSVVTLNYLIIVTRHFGPLGSPILI